MWVEAAPRSSVVCSRSMTTKSKPAWAMISTLSGLESLIQVPSVPPLIPSRNRVMAQTSPAVSVGVAVQKTSHLPSCTTTACSAMPMADSTTITAKVLATSRVKLLAWIR